MSNTCRNEYIEPKVCQLENITKLEHWNISTDISKYNKSLIQHQVEEPANKIIQKTKDDNKKITNQEMIFIVKNFVLNSPMKTLRLDMFYFLHDYCLWNKEFLEMVLSKSNTRKIVKLEGLFHG